MLRRSTPDQAERVAIVGVAVLALLCAWRWWWAPSRSAIENAAAPELVAARESVLARVPDIGILEQRSADLRWRAPGSCVEVYRVRIDEEFRDASVAIFVGREEDHSSWLLALGRAGTRTLGVLAREDLDDEVRVRELSWSASAIGPAAPDFACRRRSWDPIEDALAPRLAELAGRSHARGRDMARRCSRGPLSRDRLRQRSRQVRS